MFEPSMDQLIGNVKQLASHKAGEEKICVQDPEMTNLVEVLFPGERYVCENVKALRSNIRDEVLAVLDRFFGR